MQIYHFKFFQIYGTKKTFLKKNITLKHKSKLTLHTFPKAAQQLSLLVKPQHSVRLSGDGAAAVSTSGIIGSPLNCAKHF